MLEILEFGNKFAVGIFDIYIIVRLLNAIFKGKLYDKRFLYFVILLDIIVVIMLGYYAPPVFINIIMNLLFIFLFTCCYKNGIWEKVNVTLGIIILTAISELLIALIIGIDNLSLMSEASNRESIAFFLSRIVMWIFTLIIQKVIVRDNLYKLSAKIMILEITLLFSIICELLFFSVGEPQSAVMESAVLLASEITVYLMIYLQDCLCELYTSKEIANLVEREKEYYKKEAAIIQQKQEIEKQFRHDWKNRLQVLSDIAENENVLELKKYLREIEDKAKAHEIYSNTGNFIFDSIINSKLTDATKNGIDVSANITLPTKLEINEDDIVVILGNLLDNAIEACQKVSTGRYIKLRISYEEGCIILNIKNSFDKIINKFDGEYITRKEDKSLHGLEIKSVRNAVEKYNGFLEFTSKGTGFDVDIILYL